MALDSLKDLYLDQAEDIFSACKQSEAATRELASAANDGDLKKALEAGVDGIEDGMKTLTEIIRSHGGDPKGEFCKGMEGLVKEARAHGIEQEISDPHVRDAMIITQYQRMTHYAIAGYGCLLAFADRLGLKDDADKLRKALEATRHGDKTMTELATGGINKAAA